MSKVDVMREAAERIFDPKTIDARLSGLSGDQRSLLWRLYRSSRGNLTANEAALKRELLSQFQAVARGINADIANTFDNLGATRWDLQIARKLGRDQALFAQIKDRIQQLGGKITDITARGLVKQFKQAYTDSAYRLDVMTPETVEIKFGLLPDQEILSMVAEPWKGADFSQRLGIITDEMAGNIKTTLVRSMMAQESWQDAARRIRGEMGTAGQRSVWRAEMIARTELAHAQELATEVFNNENADVIEDEVWIAHPYACDECKDNHGEPVSAVGRPPLHPNCLCDVLAVPKSWSGLAQAGETFRITPVSRVEWMRHNLVGGSL